MTGNPHRPQLASELQALLGALRGKIRRYVWLEGLSAAVAWLGAAFWTSLAIDWLFEPPPVVRQIVLATALGGLAWVLFALVARRALVPLRDASMAMLFERRFPQFRDSLLTSVELAGRGAVAGDCDPVLLGRTCALAEASARGVRAREVLDPRPLGRRAAAALALAVSVGLFATMRPDLLSVWARRSFALSDELWPRRTWLEIEGFEGGAAKIARGADLDVRARASVRVPPVPQVLEIRYREGGGRARKPMNREGTADPEKDCSQEFSYTFRSVLAPIAFDLVGGDAIPLNLRIEVVDNPTIVEMILDCQYPKYMDRPARAFPFAGVMQFPVGSRITLRARANKDLVRVTVDSAFESPPQPAQVVRPEDPSDLRSFRYALGPLRKDATLLLSLHDADGIKSREPVRVTLAAVEDRRPEFSVQLRGIGSAITPLARLPAMGRVTDDYGIARVWFERAVDKAPPAESPIASPAASATELVLDGSVLDVRELGLKPGQKLQVCLKAADRCELGSGPNVGTSDRWQLDVVTPDQLRSILQARELVLRQRFEVVVKEVGDTRDTLARVDLGARPADGAAKPPRAAAKGAEPEDKPADEEQLSPERQLAQRRLQVQWAAQNSVKNGQETLGVAEAIGEIREELVNNRIDTEELKARLESGIADPLRRIAREMFPELDRRLDRLQADLADTARGPQARTQAIQQTDAILLAMREVLGRMIELEDFNEAVELLRSIIQAQERVNVQTKERQKQRLRDLRE